MEWEGDVGANAMVVCETAKQVLERVAAGEDEAVVAWNLPLGDRSVHDLRCCVAKVV